jgi:hypothetical protein
MWPILGAIVGYRDINPFLIGIYIGRGSPDSIADYLHEYVNELKLLKNVVRIGERPIPFEIRAYCCDAPARAFLCGTQYHTGYHGCSKCCQVGYRVDKTTVFRKAAIGSRTDLSYANRTDPKFHSKKFLNESNPLECLKTGMISQVPIEPMHLLDLGVMKKVLLLFLENSGKRYFAKKELIQQTEANVLKVVEYLPQEFQRDPRGFAEVPRFKATEFRQFLLYIGPVVLKDTLESQAYNSFLKLHIACRFLYLSEQLDFADTLLASFVNDFGSVFPEKSRSYNIHSLLHIKADVEKFGLESMSNYKFENFMQILKHRMRSTTNLFSRVNNVINSKVLDRPCLHYGEICYDVNKKNNHCSLHDGRIVEIVTINGDLASGRQYLSNGISDFYPNVHPQCKSLKVFIVDPNYRSNDLIQFSIKMTVKHKLFRIPYRDKFVVFPLLHTV